MLEVAFRKTLGATTLDVGFTAKAGVTVLFGPSGAGKSSVVNAVAGLLRIDAGRIAVNGAAWSANGVHVPPHKRRTGYVFQDARLFPHMSVAQNLRYGGDHNAEAIIDVLGLGGLVARMPAGLSGGEAQRVALGRALMRNPDVLLLDEPLAALDGPRKAEVLAYLAQIKAASDIPILYVTHAMREVTALADQLILLDVGRVVAGADVGTVLADPALAGYFDTRDAGALLAGTVRAYDAQDGVSEVHTAAGPIFLAGALGAVGAAVRLRIPAHDVILALDPPQRQSALNTLPVTVTGTADLSDGGVAVKLRAADADIWAAITKRSARALNLSAGDQLFAVFKAKAMGAG